jgi:hypothetical protein
MKIPGPLEAGRVINSLRVRRIGCGGSSRRERPLGYRRSLDEEADVELVGHTDAAVHLDAFA